MNIVVLFIAFLIAQATEHCISYRDASGTCRQCEPGYALAQDMTQCLPCPLHCKVSCYINQYNMPACTSIEDSPCNPAIDHCTMCDDTQKKCTTCNDGFWLDNGDCDPCTTTSCKICAGGDPCTQCFPGFILGADVCTCPPGNFKAFNSTQCLSCDVTCDTCIENSTTPGTSKCTKCKDPNANDNQKLPSCQCNPKFRMDTTNNVCVACPALCPTCHSDAGNLPVCDSCVDPVLMDPLKNCDCKDGYYMLSTNTCGQCTQFCSICKNSGKSDGSICTSCSDKTNMIPDPDNPANCICTGNRWYTNNACTNCDASCLTCDHYVGNCITCAYSNAHSIGLTCVCNDKFFNDGSKCANCPAACAICSSLTLCTDCTDNPNMNIVGGVCECKKGTFIISTNKCMPCGTGCVECTPAGSDKSVCKTCIDPSMDIIVDICQCKMGSYLKVDKCTACDSSCLSCHNENGNGVCDTCADENAIPQGTKCVCKPYYYPDANNKCAQCPVFCQTCHLDTGTVKCDFCQYPNMIVDPSNYLCRCNDAFYQLNDNSCKACGTNCIVCNNDGKDNSVCQTCSDDKNMNKVPADGSCVCKPAFFPIGPTRSTCAACQQDCSICHNTGDDTPTCDTCADEHARPMPKDCACIARYFMYNYKCWDCPLSCDSCIGRNDEPDQPNCLSCSDNNHMSIINFVCQCNGPSYLNTDTRLCQPCGKYCNVCENNKDGTQNSHCLECADPNAAPVPPANTDCYCKNGYYPVGPTCLQCDLDCAICEFKNNNKFCDKCLDPNALPNDSGKCICIPGRYLNVNECDLCPDTCISCASVNNLPVCDLCVDPKMIMVNGICQCPNGFYLQADGTCGSCPERCSTCNLAGSIVVCDSCIDVNMITAGSDCVCKSKYYMENNVCYQCPSPCDACKSSLTPQTPVCTLCHDTANAVIVNGNCECKPSMFMLSTNMCQTCGFKCAICKNQKDLPYCEACDDGSNFIPLQGYCVCRGGYYMKTDFICYNCPVNQLCSTCFNNGNDKAICSSCIDTEGMTITKDGNCICKNHYYLVADKSRCALCVYPCYLCSLDSYNKLVCNQCSDTQNMDPQNNCQCKSHQFMSYDKKSCIECPISCANCVGDSTNTPKCNSCLDPNMILSQNCQSCLPGYYMTTDVKKCLACPDTCLLCRGLSDNSPYCTQCKDKDNMFIDNKFTCTCNSQSYFSKVEQKCHGCETRCFNCTDYGHDHCKNCNPAITYLAPFNNGVCDCDNLHKWSDAERICRIKKEPSNLLIIILAVVVGLMVAGLIFYVICIK